MSHAVLISNDGTISEYGAMIGPARTLKSHARLHGGRNVDIGPFPAMPDEAQPVPDVIYPTDLETRYPTIRFHLCAWMHGRDERREQFWSVIEAPSIFMGGRLAFLSREARSDFLRWWSDLSRHFGEYDPRDYFLPPVQTGGVSGGAFIVQRTYLDNLPFGWEKWVTRRDSNAPDYLALGLAQMVRKWGWIVENCRSPVYRIQGGWFFTSDTAAAAFKLFYDSAE